MKSIFEMLEHDVLEPVIIAGTRSVDAKDTEGLGESLLAIGAGLLTRRGKNPGERKFPFVSKRRGASVYRTRKDGSAHFANLDRMFTGRAPALDLSEHSRLERKNFVDRENNVSRRPKS